MGLRTNVRAFSPGTLADDGAARVADLQNVSANRYLPGDRPVHRQFLNMLTVAPLRPATR